MTRPDLDAIDRRCAAATEGPLSVAVVPVADGRRLLPNGEELRAPFAARVVGLPAQATDLGDYLTEADAAFIAAARSDVPDLVAYARELEAENERLRGMSYMADPGKEIALLRMRLAEAEAALLAVEHTPSGAYVGARSCPLCSAFAPHHQKDCAVGGVLARKP